MCKIYEKLQLLTDLKEKIFCIYLPFKEISFAASIFEIGSYFDSGQMESGDVPFVLSITYADVNIF